MIKNCPTINVGCDKYTPAKCIYYSGNALQCTGIIYNDSIDNALKKLDNKICELSNRINVDSVVSIGGNVVELIIGDTASAKPSTQNVPSDGDSQIVLPYKIMPNTESIFYQGVPVRLYPDNDFNYIPVYGATNTTYIFSQPLSEGYSLKIDGLKMITQSSGGGSVVGLGMQFVVKTVTSTQSTLYVPELGNFALAIQNGQPLTSPTIVQAGNNLDFSAVGGVTAGEQITIFYTNM